MGEVLSFRDDLVIPDPSLTIGKRNFGKSPGDWVPEDDKFKKEHSQSLVEQLPFDNRKPWEKFPEKLKKFYCMEMKNQEYVLKLQAGRGKAKKQAFPGILKDLEKYNENHFE